MSPSVAICIPTRNQAGFIADALKSAFGQSRMPVDVVVSDDAGTDHTAGVVEAFRDTLPQSLRSRLRYERSSVPLGIGGNFDRAVRLAEGDFVVKLDSDDILEPGFIEVLANLLQTNPQAAWAHCNVLNIRPDGSSLGLAHTRKRSGFYRAEEALPAYLRHNDTCHCVLLRKSAYLAVGGYRPQMKTCEDWLLWLEMLLAGWGYCYDSRPLARMRKYEARPDLMTRRRQHFVESLHFMKPHLEAAVQQRASGIPGLEARQVLPAFARTASRLCVSSGCDESDPLVRRALFDLAFALHPSLPNRLWLSAGAPLPASATRFATQVASLPRRGARLLFQTLAQAVR